MPQKLLQNLPHFQPYFKDLGLGDFTFSWLQIVANSFPLLRTFTPPTATLSQFFQISLLKDFLQRLGVLKHVS